MGECVSQGITLGGTIFKHPVTDKILSHILLNTMTWASWSPLYWWQLVHVMPAIASSSSCSHFSGHPASKPFNTGRDRCPKPHGGKAPVPRATCHLKPLSSGSAEVVPVSINWEIHCFVSPAHLKCCHNQIKPPSVSQTLCPLFGFPELYTRTNRQFL